MSTNVSEIAKPLTIRIDESSSSPEWDAFVVTAPGGDIVQSSAWGRVKRASGMNVARIVVEHDGEIVAGVQLVVRRIRPLGSIAYAPYGPLCSDTAPSTTLSLIVDALQQWVRTSGVRALVVQPPEGGEHIARRLRAAGMQPTEVNVAPSASMRLDLNREPDELFARMTPQTRKVFRRSLRNDIDVRFATRDDLASFHDLYCRTAERHAFEPVSLGYLQTMWDELHPSGQMDLILARVEGVDVAGSTVTCFGDVVTGRFLGFDPDRLPRRCRPNETLVWTWVEWARTQGFRWLDVGGLDREDAMKLAAGEPPEAPHKNQKVGLGGLPIVYPEPLELIPNPVLRTAHRLVRNNATVRSLRDSFEHRIRSKQRNGGSQ